MKVKEPTDTRAARQPQASRSAASGTESLAETGPFRILIADKLAPEGAAYLEDQPDVEVTTQTGLSGEELARALAEHDGVVVRSAVKVKEDVFEALAKQPNSQLKAIARAGVGVDNIDLQAATRNGVAVMNSASASTITTAEHAFALLISLARNIGPAYRTMYESGWDRSKFVGTQLNGKTLGVVGFGRIGQTVAKYALAFGMKVVAFDPFVNADEAMDGQVKMFGSFDELIKQVDAVSFHVPKNEQTAGMLSTEQFKTTRPNLLIVNASRGGIVDEQALIQALDNGQCGGAALDVYPEEPPPDDAPIRKHPRILCTPHLGASTVEAQEAVAVDACKAVLTYLRGEGVPGAVNVGRLNLDLNERQQAYRDLSSRMVGLLDAAIDAKRMNKVKFTIRGESLAGRADTIARLGLAEILSYHLDEPVNVINAGVIAEQRKIDTETVIAADTGEDRLTIEIFTDSGVRKVQGAVFEDGLPRVTNLDGYHMDIVPAGHMVMVTNDDQPGRIGLVGQLFGEKNVNIAEMVIGRKPEDTSDGQVAMMIIKLDHEPKGALLDKLRSSPGIRRVASVELPAI